MTKKGEFQRRPDPLLALALLALALAALFGLLAVLDRGVPGIDPDPPMPWPVTAALTAVDARATLAPRGATVGQNGRLTLLEAPPTQGTVEPPSDNRRDLRPRPVNRVPPAMLAGIRGFFRTGTLPQEELDRSFVMTLELVYNEGRLLVVDGCFRFERRDGPLLVFGPEARLALQAGWLTVGPSGMPARFSARVGEMIAWEGKQLRGIDEKAKAGINRRCGPGEVIIAPTWSASVQAAEEESRSADLIALEMGSSFTEALALLRRCGPAAARAVQPGPVQRPVEEVCREVRRHAGPIQPPPPPDMPRPTR
jgi:hypothetical protein